MKRTVGYQKITPYFNVSDADRFIQFLEKVFDGNLLVRDDTPSGVVHHARVSIGDSVIMLNESNEHYPVNTSQMHIYVDDVGLVHSKALFEGAVSIMEPNLRPHGEKMAGFKDPVGNIWWVAKSV